MTARVSALCEWDSFLLAKLDNCNYYFTRFSAFISTGATVPVIFSPLRLHLSYLLFSSGIKVDLIILVLSEENPSLRLA